MEDQDKPFVCYEMGCGMQFTNEDHLAVHMRKHDMSLALNLSGTGMLSPTFGVFTDQTPTPTKFLKNLEEMGLFQELNKNPFDDSFKKAMDDTSDPGSVAQMSLPIADINDLDTPQPAIPKIVIGDDDSWSKGVERTKDTLSSIVPKKRKKFLRQQSMPTSTTSEDESESVIGSSSADIGSSSMEGGDSEEILLEVHALQDVTSSVAPVISTTVVSSPSPGSVVSSSMVVGSMIEKAQPPAQTPVQPQPKSPAQSQVTLSAMSPAQPSVQPSTQPLVQSPAQSLMQSPAQSLMQSPAQPLMQSPAQALVQSASLPSDQLSVQSAAPPSDQPSAMVQVLLQLPGGLTVPIQVPAANIVSPKQTIQAPRPVVQNNVPAPKPQIIQTGSHTSPFIVTGNQPILQTMQGPILNQQQTLIQQTPQSSLPMNVKTISLGTNQVVPVMSQSITNQTQAVPNVISQVTNKTLLIQQNPGPQLAVNQSGIQIGQHLSPPRVTVPQKKVQSGSQSYTKQRLKAALQQQQASSLASQKISHILQANEIKQEYSQMELDNQSMVSPSGSISSPEERPFNLNLGNSDILDPNEDPETRRKKFLERNRAAAARCRQKRKYWITNLESKADDLSNQNSRLCNEVKALRGEVAQLKTLLIAHKDCPVTMQQRLQGQINADTFKVDAARESEDPNVVHIYDDVPITETTKTSTLPNVILTNNTETPTSAVDASNVVQNVISLKSISVNNSMAVPNVIPNSITVPTVIPNSITVPNVIPNEGQMNGSSPASSVGQFMTLPRFVTGNQASVQDTNPTISVITGPNSIGLLPKLFNLEQLIQSRTNQTS